MVLAAYQAEIGITQVRIPWVAVIPFGLAVVILMQALLGMLTVGWDAVLPIAYLVTAAFACALGATLSTTKHGAHCLCKSIVLAHVFAGVVSAGIASLQFFSVESHFGSFVMPMPHKMTGVRPFANVAQPNQLALLFCMAIAGIWWLLQERQIRGLVAFVTVLILAWGLALTQSRIGWLIVPTFAIMAWSWHRKEEFLKISRRAIIALIAIYSGFIIALPYLSSAIGTSTASLVDRVGGQSERLILFKQAFHISANHPFFGAGWYEFGPEQVNIGAQFLPSVYSQHAHNMILNLAAEVGWLVTIVVLGAGGYWIMRVWRYPKINKETCFAMMFFAAVLIHSLVEFPLWYAYVLLPFALLIGMVHQEQLNSRAWHIPKMPVGWGLLAVAMMIGLVFTAIDYRRVVIGFRALGMHSFGLASDDKAMNKPAYTIFPHFYDYFSFARYSARKGMSDVEITNMEQVSLRFGYAPVLMRMSLVYALNGRPEESYKSLMTINRLHPRHYKEAYFNWKSMTISDPGIYQPIFTRLPAPQN